MVRRTQKIRLQNPTNCLSMFDHFVGLVVKELIDINSNLSHDAMAYCKIMGQLMNDKKHGTDIWLVGLARLKN